MQTHTVNIKNKKAYFDYEIEEKYIAGLKLTGTEIKSVRMGKVSLADAYCVFIADELFVRGMTIAEYAYGTYNNHDPNNDRKLLLNRKELKRLERKVKEKGFTIVALRIFIADSGYAKLEIALARGKREFDKREVIKQKDIKRDLDRLKKMKL